MSYVLAGIIGAFLATSAFFALRLRRPDRAPQGWYVILSLSISTYLTCEALLYSEQYARHVGLIGRVMEGAAVALLASLLGFAAGLASARITMSQRLLASAPLMVWLYAWLSGTGLWFQHIDHFRFVFAPSGERLSLPEGPVSSLLPAWLLVASLVLGRAALHGVTMWRANRKTRGATLSASCVVVWLSAWYDVAVDRGLLSGPYLAEYALLGLALTALLQTAADERAKEAQLAAERESMLEKVRTMQRMEALGRLAGGVAHDFNNMLTVMMGGTELAKRRLHEPTSALLALESVEMAAHSAAGVTQQLLAFARREVVEPSVIALGQRVKELEPMLRRLVHDDVRLAVELAPDELHVRIGPAQLEQILFNLVSNAAQAMPSGGELVVRVARASDVPAALRRAAKSGAEEFAIVCVRDSGMGIAAEHLERIFEPFFTTKPVGKGTGLGLATVYGASQQAGGGVTVESQLGAGSTFTVFLPITGAPLRCVRTTAAHHSLPKAKRSLLLVEDHDYVRDIIRSQLATLGYDVIALRSGSEALAFDGDVDAVVSDVIMPELSGPELVLRLRSRKPNLPVLFVTGYAEDELSSRGFALEAGTVLSKPFALDTLGRALERVLAASRESLVANTVDAERSSVAS